MQKKKYKEFFFQAPLCRHKKTAYISFILVLEKATTMCTVIMINFGFYFITTAALGMPYI